MMPHRRRWMATTYQRMVFVDLGWHTMLFWNTPKFGLFSKQFKVCSVENYFKLSRFMLSSITSQSHQGTCSCRCRCRRFTAKCARRRRSDRRRSSCTLCNAHTPHSVFSTNHCAVSELQTRHIIVCLQLQCFLFEFHGALLKIYSHLFITYYTHILASSSLFSDQTTRDCVLERKLMMPHRRQWMAMTYQRMVFVDFR